MRNNQLTHRWGLSIMEIYNGQIILSWVSQALSPRMWEFLRPIRNILQNIYAQKMKCKQCKTFELCKNEEYVFFKKRHLCTEMRFYLITFLKFYYRYLLCKVSYFTFFVPFLLNDRSALSINTIVNIFDICLFLLFAFLPDLHAYSKLVSCGDFSKGIRDSDEFYNYFYS